MVTARFRFHGILERFLPRARRGADITLACARDASVKHMVEALGVPHTEVALLLVGGAPAGFEQRLREGDQVAVYPASGLPDGVDEGGLQQRPGGRPLFVADAHLGALARLLRMAGYDTLYDNHYRDDEIERIACDQARILLTRDRELLKRRSVAFGCYLHAIEPAAQLRELFARLDLGADMRPFSLCLHCNLPLRRVAKDEVLDRLPPRVAQGFDVFTACDGCARVYWQGSHHERMRALLEDVAGFKAGVELAPTPDSRA